jgi:hypothetical protein
VDIAREMIAGISEDTIALADELGPLSHRDSVAFKREWDERADAIVSQWLDRARSAAQRWSAPERHWRTSQQTNDRAPMLSVTQC